MFEEIWMLKDIFLKKMKFENVFKGAAVACLNVVCDYSRV